ncbi:hypothetical protein MA16_Dca006067 [Dendrobium catenatum]|uniref:Uncharacterized protein n=1 Tax=Dendrobium catenatum TaxID=906689 RepID=A0A2I0WK31_9ASPA|nr:hypothetical protein MA16_Dca006067 [Dendrobium catenatum]
MGGNNSNNPKLFITPPVHADTNPMKLQNVGKDDGYKEAKEQHTLNIGERSLPVQRACQVDVLIIWGEQERLFPLKKAYELKK